MEHNKRKYTRIYRVFSHHAYETWTLQIAWMGHQFLPAVTLVNHYSLQPYPSFRWLLTVHDHVDCSMDVYRQRSGSSWVMQVSVFWPRCSKSCRYLWRITIIPLHALAQPVYLGFRPEKLVHSEAYDEMHRVVINPSGWVCTKVWFPSNISI